MRVTLQCVLKSPRVSSILCLLHRRRSSVPGRLQAGRVDQVSIGTLAPDGTSTATLLSSAPTAAASCRSKRKNEQRRCFKKAGVEDLSAQILQDASRDAPGRRPRRAIVVSDRRGGTAGMKLVERPVPQPSINDVVVQVYASGFVNTELDWPSTWTDRLERDRTPSILGHELAGVVTALGYGTTGLSIGQRVFGLTDWYRDGKLAEDVAVEGRNLTTLPGDVDYTVGAALVMPGLTAWQGLFEHGRLHAGQRVLVHGAAGVVGSMASQLAREAGAYVIGTGRAAARQTALDFGAQEFVDLDNDALEDVGEVDLVFDVLGGDIAKRSAGVIRAGGTLVTVTGPTEARPSGGLTVDFVVIPDCAQLSELVQRVRVGRLRTNIGNVAALDDAVAAFNRTERIKGKTIICGSQKVTRRFAA